MFEDDREEDDEAWIDQFDNSKMIMMKKQKSTAVTSLVTPRTNGRRHDSI
jgi:hypothetical protein